MIALIYHGPGDFRCETAADPAIVEDGDVIVAVEMAAVCGSDLHVWRGTETGLDQGTVLGHEMTGRVVATGRGVRQLAIGDQVMCPFSTCCGTCFFCARGLSARCERGQLFGWVERGRGLHGAQAEHVRVPLADSTLLRVPDDLGQGGALAMGRAHEWGTVEAGKAADLVVGADPTRDIANLRRILKVVRGGVVRDAHELRVRAQP